MWPAVYIRLDNVYLIKLISCYYSNPRSIYFLLLVQVFHYFYNIFDLGITFYANTSDELISYTNFDYASLVNGPKSRKIYIFILLNGFLSY